MPDPFLIVIGMSVALAVSAVLTGAIGLSSRLGGANSVAASWSLAIGIGFLVGCWVLGIRTHWRPREDLDRLLLVVLPAVVVVEFLAAVPQVSRWLVWAWRVAIVAMGARVLLHGTSYITDLTGPGTSEWSPARAWLILGGLALVQAVVWALLGVLAAQRSHGPLSICLAVTATGAAVTVMLSGYATGGQIRLPLAGSIMGATVAALVLSKDHRARVHQVSRSTAFSACS